MTSVLYHVSLQAGAKELATWQALLHGLEPIFQQRHRHAVYAHRETRIQTY